MSLPLWQQYQILNNPEVTVVSEKFIQANTYKFWVLTELSLLSQSSPNFFWVCYTVDIRFHAIPHDKRVRTKIGLSLCLPLKTRIRTSRNINSTKEAWKTIRHWIATLVIESCYGISSNSWRQSLFYSIFTTMEVSYGLLDNANIYTSLNHSSVGLDIAVKRLF